MTLQKNKTKGQRFQEAEKGVQQLQMATRVNQMLVQQIGNSVTGLSKDLGELSGRQRDAQYRILAIQALLGLSLADIDKKAEEMQIKDFEEASAKEDAAEGYTDVDFVEENSVVVLTSKVGDTGGILRTRLKVAELGFPQLRDDLLAKKVGDVVEADINGAKHTITVLGIKNAPEKVSDDGQSEQKV